MGNRIDFLAHIVERRKKEVAMEEEEEQQAGSRTRRHGTNTSLGSFSPLLPARSSSLRRLLCEKLFMLKNMLIYAITAGICFRS